MCECFWCQLSFTLCKKPRCNSSNFWILGCVALKQQTSFADDSARIPVLTCLPRLVRVVALFFFPFTHQLCSRLHISFPQKSMSALCFSQFFSKVIENIFLHCKKVNIIIIMLHLPGNSTAYEWVQTSQNN